MQVRYKDLLLVIVLHGGLLSLQSAVLSRQSSVGSRQYQSAVLSRQSAVGSTSQQSTAFSRQSAVPVGSRQYQSAVFSLQSAMVRGRTEDQANCSDELVAVAGVGEESEESFTGDYQGGGVCVGVEG